MGKYAKWIFAGLGWAISGGSPIGALLGYAVGKRLFSDDSQQIGSNSTQGFSSFEGHRGPYRNTGTQADVNVALMVLIAAVMKADGAVKRSELDFVKRFLLQNYGEERGKEMLKLLQQLVQQDIPIDQVCSQIKVNTDYNTRYHMVDFLFGIGGADGEFHSTEINMLRLIAQYLGISQSDYRSIHERHVGSQYNDGYSNGYSGGGSPRSSYSKDPYRVLGISSDATDDEVRKAYRKMAMKYHPDRVAGMGEEIQRNAADQMKEINQAYDEIKHRRPNLK
ncbi:MAG: TerB family tellurite resistance protein [Bacteroidales bacterium]|nr:TerB family tellurite resistance protein [Bacteroidales bacterium]